MMHLYTQVISYYMLSRGNNAKKGNNELNRNIFFALNVLYADKFNYNYNNNYNNTLWIFFKYAKVSVTANQRFHYYNLLLLFYK